MKVKTKLPIINTLIDITNQENIREYNIKQSDLSTQILSLVFDPKVQSQKYIF
jgi:hypothetical protein